MLWKNTHENILLLIKLAQIYTDASRLYPSLGKEFASHERVNHSKKEYVRGDVTTNTIEGFFSILKRGINGTFHSVSKEHLHRLESLNTSTTLAN